MDATFGANGVARFAPADNYPRYEMAMLPRGRLLVAHPVSNSTDLFMLLADGTPDASFGRAGVLNLPDVFVAGLVAQPDGRVVLASARDASTDVTFMRLNGDGSIDSMFGANGKTIFPFEYVAFVPKMRLMPDGSVMAVLASRYNYGSGYVFVVKLNPAGAFDTSYGTAGAANPGFFFSPIAPGAGLDVGIPDNGGVELMRSGPTSIAKSRLTTTGALDTTVGALGLLSANTILPPGTFGAPLIAALLDDGGALAYVVVTTPSQYNPEPQLKISRYGPDFTLDRAFGINGIATIGSYRGRFVGRAPDGGYLFVGNTLGALQLLKLTARGEPDAAFGTNGIARVPLPIRGDVLASDPSRAIMTPDGYLSVMTGVLIAKAQAVGDLVEFRNNVLNHYFITYDGDEARGIDAGVAGPGWSRTGGSFRPGGTTPVCRFYGTPGIGPNSHFFTASADECEAVKHARGWSYEGLGFYTTPPVNGQCAPGLQPVHRLYNNRAAQNDSNHRLVTDTSLIAPMQAQGWVHEGVVFCARS